MKTDAKYIDAIKRILNPFRRDIEPHSGDRGFCFGSVVENGIDAERRRVTAVLSTPSIDRYGEIVLPSAFEKRLPRFMENPKFLAGHVYHSADGKPTSIGHWVDVKVTDKGLIGTAQFLPKGDALADMWWFRFEHGANRTFSVGFIARGYEMREVDVDGEKKRIRHFTDAELLEVSAVEIPANADAQMLAAAFNVRDVDLTPGGDSHTHTCPHCRKAISARDQVSLALRELLNTDPGGRLACLIEDVVEACMRRSGHDHSDDIHDHGDDSPSRDRSVEGLDQLTRELKAIVG